MSRVYALAAIFLFCLLASTKAFSAILPPEERSLPEEAELVHTTDQWTEQTMPDRLREPHATPAGVFALLHVVEGSLEYRVMSDAGDILAGFTVTPGQPLVILPEERHTVSPLGEVKFFVERYQFAEQ